MTVPFNVIYADGGPPITGDGLNTFVQLVDTFATLRSFIGEDNMQASVAGQSSAGDGKGGTFYFNSSSKATDDNLTVIVPTGGTGAWLRLPITLGIASLSSADGASTTFADIGAQAASGTNVSAQNLDFHYLDSAGVRQTTRYAITSVGTVITTTGAAAALDFTLSGAGNFNADGGGYRIAGQNAVTAVGTTLYLSPSSTWTTILFGSAAATIDIAGVQVNFAAGTNITVQGYTITTPITSPAVPPLGWSSYVDVADNLPKLKKSDGTVAVVGHVNQTPASAAASGAVGTLAWDASFIYVCIAANTWKRVAIATW